MHTLDFHTIKPGKRPPRAPPTADEDWHIVPGPNQAESKPRLLVCTQGEQDGPVQTYAQYIRNLLDSQISYLEMLSKGRMEQFKRAACGCDLVIFGEPEQSFLERLLNGRPGRKAASQAPTSILVTRRPRWPIERVLLIMRMEATDEAAVDWVERLARPSGAAVTILPIVPSLPAMYNLSSRVQAGLDVLLASNTHSGQQLRSLAQRMVEWKVEGTLRLRQGEPDQQIRWEVDEGNYDLIIIGVEPYGRLQRWLLGELVGPLLGWVNRPLLIARPTQVAVGEAAHE